MGDKCKMNKCPKCGAKINIVDVKVAGARTKAKSYQCSKCDYFSFEPVSARKVVDELIPLQLKHKIVKLSGDRLGIYFNSNIVRSLDLKKGSDVYVSVPDKKHIVLEIA